jgi:hypothetical protein
MRAAVICCFFLFPGCVASPDRAVSDTGPRARLAEEFTVALGDSIPLDGTPYSVAFEKVIEDSRCPAASTCVWEGNARILIMLREFATHEPAGGRLQVEVLDLPVELNTNAKVPTEKNGAGLIVELRRLEPAPRADIPTSGYVATLSANKP